LDVFVFESYLGYKRPPFGASWWRSR